MDFTQILDTLPDTVIIPVLLIWLVWEVIRRVLPKKDDSKDDDIQPPRALG